METVVLPTDAQVDHPRRSPRARNRAPRSRRPASRLATAALVAALLPGCFTMTTTVGQGPQAVPRTKTYRYRWFALYGVVPMDDFDSKSLSGGAKDYRVTTEFTFEDVVISAITSFATFYRQTVIVEK